MNPEVQKVKLTGTNKDLHLVQDTSNRKYTETRTQPTVMNDIATSLLVPFASILVVFSCISLLFYLSSKGHYYAALLPLVFMGFGLKLVEKFIDWLRDNFFSWK